MGLSMNMRWPPRLQHLQLSGKVHGRFLWDLLKQPENFPRTMSSLTISHCPALVWSEIRDLLTNLADMLTHVELRDLPSVKQGQLDGVLDWLPNLRGLTVAVDYIDTYFGNMPTKFNASRWAEAKPLENFTLVSSGQREINPVDSFLPEDLFTLIDERYLGRLRNIVIAHSTGWWSKDDGAEVEAIEGELYKLDQENWEHKRWHYEGFDSKRYEEMSWGIWTNTPRGRGMRPRVRMLRDQ